MSAADDPISEEAFAAARLAFSRNIAILLCAALAEGGETMDAVSKRLGKPRGWVAHIISKLIDGKQKSIDPVATILWAAGGYVLDLSEGTMRFRRMAVRSETAVPKP